MLLLSWCPCRDKHLSLIFDTDTVNVGRIFAFEVRFESQSSEFGRTTHLVVILLWILRSKINLKYMAADLRPQRVADVCVCVQPSIQNQSNPSPIHQSQIESSCR